MKRAALQDEPATPPGARLQPRSAVTSRHDGEQTIWIRPSSLRDFSIERGRCLPHRKHDIVVVPSEPTAEKGEPGVFDW
jgi:hypothetical protein